MKTTEENLKKSCIHRDLWENDGMTFCVRCGAEMVRRYCWTIYKGERIQQAIWVEAEK